MPSILAQLVSLLYNIIDRIFIARIPGYGSLAIAALGVTVPLITVINAFANLVGMGGAPLASIELGRKNVSGAQKILWNSFSLLVVLAVLLTLIIAFYMKPLLYMFGASDEIIGYSISYVRIINIGNFFSMAALALSAFLSTQGFNSQSMIFSGIGAALNMILDPLFIFVFDLGITGAAVATVISQAVSAFLILIFLCGNKTRIRLSVCKIDLVILKRIFALGGVTFFMTFTESIVNSVFNRQLLFYGNSYYLSAYSVFFTITQIIMTPIYGINQGSQPIVSYNFGASNSERLSKAIWYNIKCSFAFSGITTIIIFAFPNFFLKIFTDDPQILTIAPSALRLYIFGRLLCGVQWAIQSNLRAMGNALYPFIIMSIRKLILIVPLAFIIPALTKTGTSGVFISESVSDIISATCAFFIFRKFRRRHLRQPLKTII